MDPALKQRLLGAAVLLALLVIFVPMFFPGPAQKADDDAGVNLDIPAAPSSAPLHSRVFELDIPSRPQAQAEEAAPSATAAGVDSLPTVDTAQVAAAPQAPAPDATDAAQPEKPVDAGDSTAEQPAPQQAPAATPGRAAATGFAVSVGVFASSANADTRLAEVKLLGFPAYIADQQVDGKPAHGVRVGPYDGRASAEAARLRLQQQLPKAEPSLVALGGTQTEDAPADAIGNAEAGSWAVQLAAFHSREDAMALRDKARAAGFEAFLDDTRNASGTWWRVRVGPRTQRSEAEALKKQVHDKLGRKGLVVTQS